MQPQDIPKTPNEITVVPRMIEVVLSDAGASPLIATMPPIEDLVEMEAMANTHFSLSSLSSMQDTELEDHFLIELERLRKKFTRFERSTTYLNRLSSLARLAGNKSAESEYIDQLNNLSSDPFFQHKRAESQLANGNAKNAEAMFLSMDLANDVYANLRLASFHAQKNELVAAEEYVQQALRCDPFDFRARLFEGGLHLVRGEYATAIFSFRIAAEEKPTSSTLFTNTAIAYIGLKNFDKAAAFMRKAVALDPLNIRAVALLADLAFFRKKSEDALPSLRYFLSLEQKNAHMWGRLARASLSIGLNDEAIQALKRQGSIEQSSAVWNNLGVAYETNGDLTKALASFTYAAKIAEVPSSDYFLAARNLVQFYYDHQTIREGEILNFVDEVLSHDSKQIVQSSPVFSDLYAFKINLLRRALRSEEALRVSTQVLELTDPADRLVMWIVASLVAKQALQGTAERDALPLIAEYGGYLARAVSVDAPRRQHFFNNVAFALAELGRVSDARKALSFISGTIRKEAYPTATLGLINFREGRVDRATDLYEAAIRLAVGRIHKNRIRQKLNLELARFIGNSDVSKASRLLEKVAREKHGEELLTIQANKLLTSLRGRSSQE